jgi:hypothetical protein
MSRTGMLWVLHEHAHGLLAAEAIGLAQILPIDRAVECERKKIILARDKIEPLASPCLASAGGSLLSSA